MRSKGKLYQIIAIVLALLLTVGHAGFLLSAGRQEPADPIVSEADQLLTETYTDQVSEGYMLMAAGSGDHGASGQEDGEEEQEESQESDETQEEETSDDQTETETGTPESGDGQQTASDNGPSAGNDSGNGSGDDGKGNTGDKNTDGKTEIPEQPVLPPEEAEEGLVTDLSSRTVFFSELRSDTLKFYAYYNPKSVDADIRVNYRHESSSGNGTWLSANGHDYQTTLKLGRNYITVYYTDSAGKDHNIRYTITYEADKADQDTPEMGDHPPIISTNLDGWQGYITQQNFTFLVKARTWQNQIIYENHIRVTMDGKTITNPTGNSTYEYVLWFERPNDGDIGDHTVTVLAWDDEGNSRYVEYHIQYYAQDDGAVIGSVTIVLDATSVGLGLLEEPVTVELIQGETSADALLRMLDEYGYTADYAGTTSVGFYLRSLYRADTFRGAEIPDHLKELLERDGATFTAPCSRDELGEFDFTRWSGWMCAVNGSYYIGKGLSEYRLNDGDTLNVRYTVAMGKDIGGYDSTGGNYGTLSGYCGKWIDGNYIAGEHRYEETDRLDPKPGENGYVTYTCRICGDEYTETLDALPVDPENPDPENPDPGKPDPDNPDPGTPDPDKPDPGTPDPDKPDPGTPDPDKPDPGTPDPDKPDPGTPDPDPGSGGGGETPDPDPGSGGGGETPDPDPGSGGEEPDSGSDPESEGGEG